MPQRGDGIDCKLLILVRPERFELPTFWFVASRFDGPIALILLVFVPAKMGHANGSTDAVGY